MLSLHSVEHNGDYESLMDKYNKLHKRYVILYEKYNKELKNNYKLQKSHSRTSSVMTIIF